jgi:hypothetical protein
MRQLRGFLLVTAALLLAGQAGAASFTVTDYTLGYRVSYELQGDAGRAWTAQLQATLDGAVGTSLCADLEQYIGIGTFEGEVYAPGDLAGYDYSAAAAIAHAWANKLETLVGDLGVGVRDAITGVQVAIWQALYDGDLVVDLALLELEHPDSIAVLDHVTGGTPAGYGAEMVVLFRSNQDQIFTPGVPEPSALLCFGLGGLVIARSLRSKKR